MEILQKSFGFCETNCYILKTKNGEIIIDPGQNSASWIKQNCKNPLAIFNTHGHFDHVFDDFILQSEFKIPIFINKFDAFLLKNDPFEILQNSCEPDFLLEPNESVEISDLKATFHHFAGHTPGNCIIEIDEFLFSGDFLFKNSIGRYDFAFSSQKNMKKSLQKIKTWTKDFKLLPGHGSNSTLQKELENIDFWIENL